MTLSSGVEPLAAVRMRDHRARSHERAVRASGALLVWDGTRPRSRVDTRSALVLSGLVSIAPRTDARSVPPPSLGASRLATSEDGCLDIKLYYFLLVVCIVLTAVSFAPCGSFMLNKTNVLLAPVRGKQSVWVRHPITTAFRNRPSTTAVRVEHPAITASCWRRWAGIPLSLPFALVECV